MITLCCLNSGDADVSSSSPGPFKLRFRTFVATRSHFCRERPGLWFSRHTSLRRDERSDAFVPMWGHRSDGARVAPPSRGCEGRVAAQRLRGGAARSRRGSIRRAARACCRHRRRNWRCRTGHATRRRLRRPYWPQGPARPNRRLGSMPRSGAAGYAWTRPILGGAPNVVAPASFPGALPRNDAGTAIRGAARRRRRRTYPRPPSCRRRNRPAHRPRRYPPRPS